MSEAEYFQARSAAVLAAIAIDQEHPAQIADDMIKGYCVGFFLAYAKAAGWEAAFSAVNLIAALERGKQGKCRPILVVNNVGEVA